MTNIIISNKTLDLIKSHNLFDQSVITGEKHYPFPKTHRCAVFFEDGYIVSILPVETDTIGFVFDGPKRKYSFRASGEKCDLPENAPEIIGGAIFCALKALEIMSQEKTILAAAPRNETRRAVKIARKIDNDALIGDEYRMLNLFPFSDNYIPEEKEKCRKAATPKYHMVRGHWRNHPTAGRVWVRSCHRGDQSKGTIYKDYEINDCKG